MMIFINAVNKESVLPKDMAEGFIKLLNPIAPFMTEEIWEILGHKETIAYEKWPEYNEDLMKDEEITIGVQVNGKLRGEITIPLDDEEEHVLDVALNNEKVKGYIVGKEIIKKIVVKNRIVNIIVK